MGSPHPRPHPRPPPPPRPALVGVWILVGRGIWGVLSAKTLGEGRCDGMLGDPCSLLHTTSPPRRPVKFVTLGKPLGQWKSPCLFWVSKQSFLLFKKKMVLKFQQMPSQGVAIRNYPPGEHFCKYHCHARLGNERWLLRPVFDWKFIPKYCNTSMFEEHVLYTNILLISVMYCTNSYTACIL